MYQLNYPKFLKNNPLIWGVNLQTIMFIALGIGIGGNIFKLKEGGLLILSFSIYLIMTLYQKKFKRQAFYFWIISKNSLDWALSLKKIRKSQ